MNLAGSEQPQSPKHTTSTATIISIAVGAIAIIGGVIAGPVVYDCATGESGFGVCISDSLRDANLLPGTDTAETGDAAIEVADLPDAETVETPAATPETDTELVDRPVLDLVRAEPDGSILIAGRAPADAQVEIYANGELLGVAEAQSSGDWVMMPDAPLPAGESQITIGLENSAIIASELVSVTVHEDRTSDPIVVASRTEAPAAASVEDVPATEEPDTLIVADLPADQIPAAEPDVADAPAVEAAPEPEAESTEEAPADGTAVEEPMDGQPSVEAPAIEAPSAEAPSAEVPAAEAVVTAEPDETAPAAEETNTTVEAVEPVEPASATESPATEEPSATVSELEEPAAGIAITEVPDESAPAAEENTAAVETEEPAEPVSSEELPAVEEPASAESEAQEPAAGPVAPETTVAITTIQPSTPDEADSPVAAEALTDEPNATAAVEPDRSLEPASEIEPEQTTTAENTSPVEEVTESVEEPLEETMELAAIEPDQPVVVAPVPAIALSRPSIDAIEVESGGSFFAGAGEDGAVVRLFVDDVFVADTVVSGGRWLVEGGDVLNAPAQRVRAEMALNGGTSSTEILFLLEAPATSAPEQPVGVADAETNEPEAVEAEPETLVLAEIEEPTTTNMPVDEPETAPEPEIAESDAPAAQDTPATEEAPAPETAADMASDEDVVPEAESSEIADQPATVEVDGDPASSEAEMAAETDTTPTEVQPEELVVADMTTPGEATDEELATPVEMVADAPAPAEAEDLSAPAPEVPAEVPLAGNSKPVGQAADAGRANEGEDSTDSGSARGSDLTSENTSIESAGNDIVSEETEAAQEVIAEEETAVGDPVVETTPSIEQPEVAQDMLADEPDAGPVEAVEEAAETAQAVAEMDEKPAQAEQPAEELVEATDAEVNTAENARPAAGMDENATPDVGPVPVSEDTPVETERPEAEPAPLVPPESSTQVAGTEQPEEGPAAEASPANAGIDLSGTDLSPEIMAALEIARTDPRRLTAEQIDLIQSAIPVLIAQPVGGDKSGRYFSSGRAIIRQGDTLWTIARRVYGEGVRYTEIFEANEDYIRDPALIYPGQLFALP
jgi:nucleoid-associated protein YgaU